MTYLRRSIKDLNSRMRILYDEKRALKFSRLLLQHAHDLSERKTANGTRAHHKKIFRYMLIFLRRFDLNGAP